MDPLRSSNRAVTLPPLRFTSPDPGNAGVDLTDPQSWNAHAYASNRPLTDTDPSGLQNCPAPCISYNPRSGQPGGPLRVQTLASPGLPTKTVRLVHLVGFGKQVTSYIVSGLNYFFNGDRGTEATNTLRWYLRPSTQRLQAGANILPILSMAAVPFNGGTEKQNWEVYCWARYAEFNSSQLALTQKSMWLAIVRQEQQKNFRTFTI